MNNTNTLRTELAALESRAQTLNADARDARKRLNAAREALVSGTGDNAALIAAQSEADALAGAVEAIAQRIAAKLRELAAAETGESRAAQLVELEAGASEFFQLRQESREIAKRLAGALAEMPQLFATMRRCELLHMSLTSSAQSAGLVEDFAGFADLNRASLIALEAEFLDAMPTEHRENARVMLAREREAFFSIEKESWRAPTGGAANAISPGLLPSGAYKPRVNAAV